MSRKAPLRRLVADGQMYLYSMGWSQDLDGERVVSLAIFHAETGHEHRRSGQPMRAKFLSRHPEYPAQRAAALPADVRAVLDRARELGWDGRREGWLLPASGLERPDLVLSGPTRLKEWAAGQPVYALSFPEHGLAARVAEDLALPPVPAARGAAEAQWRDERRYLLRSRWGRFACLYTRSVEGLIAGLVTLSRRAPQLGVSVSSPSARIVGPGEGEVPAAEVAPPERWAAQPEARRFAGPGEEDVVWTFTAADGPRIEAYQHHPDAPHGLWRWTSLHDAGSVERRFRNAGAGGPG